MKNPRALTPEEVELLAQAARASRVAPVSCEASRSEDHTEARSGHLAGIREELMAKVPESDPHPGDTWFLLGCLLLLVGLVGAVMSWGDGPLMCAGLLAAVLGQLQIIAAEVKRR